VTVILRDSVMYFAAIVGLRHYPTPLHTQFFNRLQQTSCAPQFGFKETSVTSSFLGFFRANASIQAILFQTVS
jgi:hypothetical protein